MSKEQTNVSSQAFKYLELNGIGPAAKMVFEPGSRLSILTGDNGLGKTFLLDCAMWALSSEWADMPAYPSTKQIDASISLIPQGANDQPMSFTYDRKILNWPARDLESQPLMLVIYARVDGSIMLWDRIKAEISPKTLIRLGPNGAEFNGTDKFTASEIWDGSGYDDQVDGKYKSRCNGLIRDWVSWQYRKDKSTFDKFSSVLTTLFPPEFKTVSVSEPTRIPHDSREIPTIQMPYGNVPIVHMAAGMRRIVSLAYMLVWAWSEHLILASQGQQSPARNMVIMIDEIESHLHPKWQRVILPALMDVVQVLNKDLQVQFILATHSPLVLASAESLWNDESDQLYHLDLTDHQDIILKKEVFVTKGQVNNWLTSNIFELKRATSIAAEETLDEAAKLQTAAVPNHEKIREVNEKLTNVLSPLDGFWPLWRYFLKQQGITV